MNTTLLIAALAMLALPGCVIRDPAAGDLTPAEYVALLRTVRWWQPPVWLAALLLAPFVVAFWWAGRNGLYWAARLVAAVAVRVADWTAMDGRRVRIYRPQARVEVRA